MSDKDIYGMDAPDNGLPDNALSTETHPIQQDQNAMQNPDNIIDFDDENLQDEAAGGIEISASDNNVNNIWNFEQYRGSDDELGDMVRPDYFIEMDANDPRNSEFASFRSELIKAVGESNFEKIRAAVLEKKILILERRLKSIHSLMAVETKEHLETYMDIMTLKSNIKNMKDLMQLLKTTVEKKKIASLECTIRNQYEIVELRNLKKIVTEFMISKKKSTDKMSADFNNIKIVVDEKIPDTAEFSEILKETQKHLDNVKQLHLEGSECNQKQMIEVERAKEKARSRTAHQMQHFQRSFEVIEISLRALYYQVVKLKHTLPYQDGEESDVE